MDRREFAVLISAAVATATLESLLPRVALAGESLSPGETAVQVSPQAAALYESALVIDCNSGPPVEDEKLPPPQWSLDMARRSGVTAVKLSLAGGVGGFDEAVSDIAWTERLIEGSPAYFTQVRVVGDFSRAKKSGQLGIINSFETPNPLGTDLKRIETFRNLGVRVMQLTYNIKSPFGMGCLGGETDGLTDLGRQAVAKMNETGVALDLSHSNTPTTAQGIAASQKPPIFSHTGCRAVYMHPRNKEDRELKALADKGGVAGIYMLPFLTASPKQPMLDDYLAHMTHALQVCGEDHVGVGSDLSMVPFDASPKAMEEFRKDVERRKKAGISAPGEDRVPYIPDMNTPRREEIIADALLKRGYTAAVAEKVLGKNWLRVFGEIWG